MKKKKTTMQNAWLIQVYLDDPKWKGCIITNNNNNNNDNNNKTRLCFLLQIISNFAEWCIQERQGYLRAAMTTWKQQFGDRLWREGCGNAFSSTCLSFHYLVHGYEQVIKPSQEIMASKNNCNWGTQVGGTIRGS